MMKDFKIIDSLDQIDDAYIVEAIQFQKEKSLLRYKRRILSVVAACVLLLFILPNLSPKIAYAMEKLPLIGPYIKVITIREYFYDDNHNQAKVKYPKASDASLSTSTSEESSQKETSSSQANTSASGLSDVNASTKAYIDTLVSQFKQDIASTKEGYSSLDVTYEVITDSSTWFTLEVSALITKADGNEQVRYYNIDKRSGKMVTLKDIFPTGYDYIGEISSDIKAQMKSKMAQDSETMYFYSDSPNSNGDFYQIAPNVDYYFDNYGHLMIAFSEASVAPAYYGPVTFTVSDSITSHLSIKP